VGEDVFCQGLVTDDGYIVLMGNLPFSGLHLIKTDQNGKVIVDTHIGEKESNPTSISLSENGYLISGRVRSESGDIVGGLYKIDSTGGVLWLKELDSWVRDSVVTDDRYIVITAIKTGIQPYKIGFYQINPDGDIQYSTVIEKSGYDLNGFAIKKLADGNFFIYGKYGTQSILLKVDRNGQIIHETLFESLIGPSFSLTPDGGGVVVGTSKTQKNGYKSIVELYKFKSAGNQEWHHSYKEDFNVYGTAIQQTTDKGYIVSGYSEKDRRSAYALKIASDGSKEWDYSFSFIADDVNFVAETPDGGYLIAGTIRNGSTPSTKDIWMAKIGGLKSVSSPPNSDSSSTGNSASSSGSTSTSAPGFECILAIAGCLIYILVLRT
jgi:hypothetical protein